MNVPEGPKKSGATIMPDTVHMQLVTFYERRHDAFLRRSQRLDVERDPKRLGPIGCNRNKADQSKKMTGSSANPANFDFPLKAFESIFKKCYIRQFAV